MLFSSGHRTLNPLPVRVLVASIAPTEKFPLASRATMALAVLALVAVVRALASVPEVMSAAAWVCVVGVLASERRESLPMQTVVAVVPVGMRAIASVPLAMSAAAWVCVVGVLAFERRVSVVMTAVPVMAVAAIPVAGA